MFDNAKAYSVAQNVESTFPLFDNTTGSSAIQNVGNMFLFSIINPQKLLKDFSTNFKETYTAWVNGEKNKTNGK